jgi:hypothetical protein
VLRRPGAFFAFRRSRDALVAGDRASIAEGIESALAAALAYTPIWSAIDAGNMAGLPVLAGIEELLIAADNDDAGIRAANALAERWVGAGRRVRIARSETAGADLADEACR